MPETIAALTGHVIVPRPDGTRSGRNLARKAERKLRRAGVPVRALADGRLDAHEVPTSVFGNVVRDAQAGKWAMRYVPAPKPAVVIAAPLPRMQVAYRDYPALDLSDSGTTKLPLPYGFMSVLEKGSKAKVLNSEWLRAQVVNYAQARFGFSESDLSTLSPRQAIDLSLAYVTDTITYRLVDEDREFLAAHGAHLPIDEYLRLEEGDCDKYSSGVTAVFAILKKESPALTNVYVVNHRIGGALIQPHAWNAIFVVRPDSRVEVSHVDPTFVDNDGELLGDRGWHLPEDDRELRARILTAGTTREAHVEAWTSWEAVYADLTSPEAKADALDKMRFIAGATLHDASLMATLHSRFEELREHLKPGRAARLHAGLLYYSRMAAERNRDFAAKTAFGDELLTRYPDDFWATIVTKARAGS